MKQIDCAHTHPLPPPGEKVSDRGVNVFPSSFILFSRTR
jgi:hypothetical protein